MAAATATSYSNRPASPIGRNLSPLVKQELANLDKDFNTRRTAMKALRSYVRELDSKSIPKFLAQVSEKEATSSSYEHTISLFEVLARVHGKNIVPQIENIMSTIVVTLNSSAGSYPLQQSCAKVVPTIARYGIDPLIPDVEKASIIESLATPLWEVLMGSPECLTSGAALCLKSLVECDNWRFASEETVNMVCLHASGALEEKSTQTHSHMSLIMSLAKTNPLMIEGYARSLIRSALEVSKIGVGHVSAQKRLNAIQMINSIMKHVDSRSICSELHNVTVFLEKCRIDPLMFVRSAALEALVNAKNVAAEKKLKLEDNGDVGGLIQIRECKRSLWGASSSNVVDENRRPVCAESQTFTYLVASPESSVQSCCTYGRGSARKLWKNEKNVVDVSLKDGLFLYASTTSDMEDETEDCKSSVVDNFAGFECNAENPSLKNDEDTPISKKSQMHLTIDDIKIYTTPRKLIRSLQDEDPESEVSQKIAKGELMNFSEVECNSQLREYMSKGFVHFDVLQQENNEGSGISYQNHIQQEKPDCLCEESVSSTPCGPVVQNENTMEQDDDSAVACMLSNERKTVPVGTRERSSRKLFILGITTFVILLALLAVVSFSAQENGQNYVCDNVVPT